MGFKEKYNVEYEEIDGIFYPKLGMEELTRNTGKYGEAWKEYMRENYPMRSQALFMSPKWNEIADRVQQEAEKYQEELRKIYEKQNPRPQTDDFMEIYRWKTEMELRIEHQIMEEIVLIRRDE